MANKGNSNPNPLPPKGGERIFDVADITGSEPARVDRDQSVVTSTPALAPSPTGPLGTGVDRDDKTPNTEPTTPPLDTSRDSYTGSEDPPQEAQGLDLQELSNPMRIGGQLVQDAPFTAEPHVPPGTVPAPGKEFANVDELGRSPYPAPVEGTGANHVAYATEEAGSGEDR